MTNFVNKNYNNYEYFSYFDMTMFMYILLEEDMATHSRILAWRFPMDRRAWYATVHEVAESDMTEWLSTAQHTHKLTTLFLPLSHSFHCEHCSCVHSVNYILVWLSWKSNEHHPKMNKWTLYLICGRELTCFWLYKE